MGTIKELIATNIVALRKAKGWTQHDLSAASGIPYRTIQDIENLKSTPRPENIADIAEALEIEELELVDIDAGKLGLIISIQAGLPTLNEDELSSVKVIIDRALSRRSSGLVSG